MNVGFAIKTEEIASGGVDGVRNLQLECAGLQCPFLFCGVDRSVDGFVRQIKLAGHRHIQLVGHLEGQFLDVGLDGVQAGIGGGVRQFHIAVDFEPLKTGGAVLQDHKVCGFCSNRPIFQLTINAVEGQLSAQGAIGISLHAIHGLAEAGHFCPALERFRDG